MTTGITRTTLLDEPQRQILLNGLREMPDGHHLCHGDFHPRNVLGEASHPIVIDWPNVCCGDPAADVCRSYPATETSCRRSRRAVPRCLLSGRPCPAPDNPRLGCGTSERPDWPKTSRICCTPQTAGTGSPKASTAALIAASRNITCFEPVDRESFTTREPHSNTSALCPAASRRPMVSLIVHPLPSLSARQLPRQSSSASSRSPQKAPAGSRQLTGTSWSISLSYRSSEHHM